jgi:hypothetical protein
MRQRRKHLFNQRLSGLLTSNCRSYLSDTLTICTDDPQRPIQFSIYGYIIITSTSHVLNSLFKDQKARAHKDVILALLEELISREVFVKEVTFSGRSRKEVEDACYNFVQGMQIERVK